MEYQRVVAVQDDDCHWYVIPYQLKEKFFELDEKVGSENFPESSKADDDFYELFSKYATGGDLNNTILYIKDGE